MSSISSSRPDETTVPVFADWVHPETRDWFRSLLEGKGRHDEARIFLIADRIALKGILSSSRLERSANAVLKSLEERGKPIQHFNHFLLKACVVPTVEDALPASREMETEFRLIEKKELRKRGKLIN